MPISPEFKTLYGHKWRTVTRPRVLARCAGRCERCRRMPRRIEVAHLDQNPHNDDLENLAAVCSRCHHAIDYEVWAAKARDTRRARKDRGRPLLRGIN
jgi:hypothetical protein